MTVAELHALELILLSSCESEMNAGLVPDEIITLHGPLFSAVGCDVVSTLWAAEQAPTAPFFEDFYAALDDSHTTASVAAALRRAQIDVRDFATESGERPFHHRSYWSTFTLIG